jgi:hypothetical protein
MFERVVISECRGDFAAISPVEYFVRMCNVLPQILTTACHGILGKSANSLTIETLFTFVNNHMSFLTYLEKQSEKLLTLPRVSATLDETAEETCWYDLFVKDEERLKCDGETINQAPEAVRKRVIRNGKRKLASPLFKPMRSVATYE